MDFMVLLVFLTGICIGSFLNVVVCRVPEGKSIIFPPSHCPVCKKPIASFDLIPVISWILLRGRCRVCNARISWRYPAVELMTGLIFTWVYGVFAYSPTLFLMFVLASVLISISFIDWEYGIIPFSILAVGAVPALCFAVSSVNVSLWDAVVGSVLGGGVILATDMFSKLIYKHPGMGGGDVALMFMAGLFLGLRDTALSLFIGVVSGGIYAAFLLLSGKVKKNGTLPFGPFLAIGIWISALYGHRIIHWYLSMIGYV